MKELLDMGYQSTPVTIIDGEAGLSAMTKVWYILGVMTLLVLGIIPGGTIDVQRVVLARALGLGRGQRVRSERSGKDA